MEHVLDNPAWNALLSGNYNLYFGFEHIKYFDRDVSPFVAFNENTEENFVELSKMLPYDRPVLFVATSDIAIPPVWNVLRAIHGVQMVYMADRITEPGAHELVPLTNDHVSQMLELTKLTNPGPFGPRTIDFGHYQGIFEDDQLVAMAGQRLHAFNYTEVSAVCTRPGYTGKGYARQLITAQVNRMTSNGNTPYLHARGDNQRAIQLYESLGFETRSGVCFYFMMKA